MSTRRESQPPSETPQERSRIAAKPPQPHSALDTTSRASLQPDFSENQFSETINVPVAVSPPPVPETPDENPVQAPPSLAVSLEAPADAPQFEAPPPGPDLEAELGREKAEFYREQESLAFQEHDEDEDKREIDVVSTQLSMSLQQQQASTVIYEDSLTALSQQRETFRRESRTMNAEERLQAVTKLALFRKTFIFNRLKSVLTPDQLSYYRENFAPVAPTPPQ